MRLRDTPLIFTAEYLRLRFFETRPSFGQYNEDLVVRDLLGSVSRFIDVGASDGVTFSNTLSFGLAGASGLCFEPDATAYRKLRWFYLLNRRVTCIHEGLSSKDHTLAMRQDGLYSTILDTQDPTHSRLHQEYFDPNAPVVPVHLRRLDYWTKEYPEFSSTDLITIDVEGHELAVLEGMDLSRSTTRCFLVETHVHLETRLWTHRDFGAINQLLDEAGYVAVLQSPLNTFWLRRDSVVDERIAKVVSERPDYRDVRNSRA